MLVSASILSIIIGAQAPDRRNSQKAPLPLLWCTLCVHATVALSVLFYIHMLPGAEHQDKVFVYSEQAILYRHQNVNDTMFMIRRRYDELHFTLVLGSYI